MGAAQYLKRVADKGGDFNGNLSYTDLWLQTTMKATVQIFGNDRITRIEIWNQETKQWISFLLSGGSSLREEAEVWPPSGYGKQESKEELGVEKNDVESTTTVVDEDTSTSTTLGDAGRPVEQKMFEEETAVETMSYEKLAKAVDEQKAADEGEADCVEAADTNVETMSVEQIVKHMEQEVDQLQNLSEDKKDMKQNKVEEDVEHGEDTVGATGVQHVCFNAITTRNGREAAMQQAARMFNQKIEFCESLVVKYYVSDDVSQEENCLLAKGFVKDVTNEWNEWVNSHTPANQKNKFVTEGWKETCLAYKDMNLKLAEGVNTFEQEYCTGLLSTEKKMVKRMCNGYYVTCTEMSSMYDDFATAEEDDSWKGWVTSDEYLDVLTLR